MTSNAPVPSGLWRRAWSRVWVGLDKQQSMVDRGHGGQGSNDTLVGPGPRIRQEHISASRIPMAPVWNGVAPAAAPLGTQAPRCQAQREPQTHGTSQDRSSVLRMGKTSVTNLNVQVRSTGKTIKHVIGELCEDYHHGHLWSPHCT